MMQQQQQQHGSMSLRAAPRYPTPIQRPINYQSIGCQRFSARYKMPPPTLSNVATNTATATSASTYYVTQSNEKIIYSSVIKSLTILRLSKLMFFSLLLIYKLFNEKLHKHLILWQICCLCMIIQN